jgi:N-methylhydantoinase A
VRVGIEVGGTFTDLLSVDRDGEVRSVKVPSVPRRPDEGAYHALAAARIAPQAIVELVHGSTVATNAVLERSGARVAFVTTRGFRDLLLLQRHNRDRVFDLAYAKPRPIVPRRDCFEVAERVLADGAVATALDETAVEAALVPALARGGYEAVAICLLNSYANPEHERRLGGLIRRRLPHLLVAASSEIAREFREYERASTTVIAAHVQPVVTGYLERLETHLADHGFAGTLSLMQSNGGRLPSAGVRRNPITALFSGPAAGVMGATRQAGRSGYRNLITFDMGGTSTDVCLVEDGEPELQSQAVIDGLPVRTPLFGIVSVGAGCGSVVWVDDGGMLRVGPASAGADPGPACYGRGGDRPTLTDAHLIRGTIRPEAFLGGTMRIDPAAAARAFAPVADRFGMALPAIAGSAIDLAEANIVRAIQLVSTERGRDPREFVLVAFGGAGPLHAANVADDLEIGTVLVPPCAGVLSAYGLLAADYRLFETRTRRVPVDAAAPAAVGAVAREMQARALGRMRELGIAVDRAAFALTVEMRFVGQAFEVPVDLDLGRLPGLTAAELLERFSDGHRRVFFHGARPRQAAEIVSFRLGVIAPNERVPALRGLAGPAASPPRRLRICERDREVDCLLAGRQGLAPGAPVPGPAILDDVTSTIFVPSGWRAEVDPGDNLILRRSRSR